jgi:DNA-binding transcriptional ArsR family regulator
MIDILFTSKVRRKLVAFFVGHPDNEFYIREVERATQADFRSVHLELARLERAGLLRSRRVANLKYYALDKTYLLYPELRSIFVKTHGWEEETQALAAAAS